MSRYITWEGGCRHEHETRAAAVSHYDHLSRIGLPCSLYVGGDCLAAGNGASDVTVGQREALDDYAEDMIGGAS